MGPMQPVVILHRYSSQPRRSSPQKRNGEAEMTKTSKDTNNKAKLSLQVMVPKVMLVRCDNMLGPAATTTTSADSAALALCTAIPKIRLIRCDKLLSSDNLGQATRRDTNADSAASAICSATPKIRLIRCDKSLPNDNLGQATRRDANAQSPASTLCSAVPKIRLIRCDKLVSSDNLGQGSSLLNDGAGTPAVSLRSEGAALQNYWQPVVRLQRCDESSFTHPQKPQVIHGPAYPIAGRSQAILPVPLDWSSLIQSSSFVRSSLPDEKPAPREHCDDDPDWTDTRRKWKSNHRIKKSNSRPLMRLTKYCRYCACANGMSTSIGIAH